MTYSMTTTVPEWAVALFLIGFVVLVAALLVGIVSDLRK